MRYADHDEVVEVGDVYDMAPDHTIVVDAGPVRPQSEEAYRTQISISMVGSRTPDSAGFDMPSQVPVHRRPYRRQLLYGVPR